MHKLNGIISVHIDIDKDGFPIGVTLMVNKNEKD